MSETLNELFVKLHLPFKKSKRKISVTFIKAYLSSLTSIMPKRYYENGYNHYHICIQYHSQLNALKRSHLQQYIKLYEDNIDILQYAKLPVVVDIAERESSPWTLLILPWICCMADFNWELIKQGIEARFYGRSSNYNIASITNVFLSDYLFNNAHYHDNTNNMINNVFALFDDNRLKMYRKIIFDIVRKYNVHMHYDLARLYIQWFTNVNISDIYTNDELCRIQDEICSNLIAYNAMYDSYYTIITDLLKCIHAWHIPFSTQALVQLKLYMTTHLHRKRSSDKAVFALMHEINAILQEYDMCDSRLINMELRKFTHTLA